MDYKAVVLFAVCLGSKCDLDRFSFLLWFTARSSAGVALCGQTMHCAFLSLFFFLGGGGVRSIFS
jgi:hypothetical protein